MILRYPLHSASGGVEGHRTRNPTNIVTFDNVVIARAYIGPSRPPQD